MKISITKPNSESEAERRGETGNIVPATVTPAISQITTKPVIEEVISVTPNNPLPRNSVTSIPEVKIPVPEIAGITRVSDEPLPDLTEIKVPKEISNGTGYAGDLVDFTAPICTQGYETLDFENPVEMLAMVDDFINSGTVKLHPWQIETLEDLGNCKATSNHPHRFALCAANGSGKDAYVIAPFIIWFAVTKKRSLTVVTSSSGVQLTAQTENYIAYLARQFNALYQPVYGKPIFKITRRFVKCLLSGSEIRMFATDEAGKAEGYHPLEPNAEMAIVVNESKSVKPEIFGALSRCTGYNYWLNVSTPGEPYGDFYDSFTNWPVKYGERSAKRVTAFMCPHLSDDHISEVKRKYGEQSAIYRSQILALFTAIGGQVVINQDYLNKCIELTKKGLIKKIRTGKIRIGADLAAGRDECVFTAVWGNEILERLCFIEKDTTVTESRLKSFIDKYKLMCNEGVEVFADDGGLGHNIIDHLEKDGYAVHRIRNQSRAIDVKQFRNLGAEMWFNFARLVEECLVPLDINPLDNDGKKLYEQLSYRHYKKNETSGSIALESKEEARANGHVSPDRADSLVLAFSGITIDDITKMFPVAPVTEPTYSLDELRGMLRANHRRAHMAVPGDDNGDKNINLSLEELLRRKFANN